METEEGSGIVSLTVRISELRLDRVRAQILAYQVPRQAGAPGILPD